MNSNINLEWIMPYFRKPVTVFNIASWFTCSSVGIFCKFLIKYFNEIRVYNENVFHNFVENRPRNLPLLTVCNHTSCFDDPGIWGLLNWRTLLTREKIRWSIAAHDICFTSKLHCIICMLAKTLPVYRGEGIYQDTLDFCIERLNRGDWVHVFPEGKVNLTKDFLRIKWGVGRLIYEAKITPIVIPIWHIGMDKVLPNETPYRLKTGNRITINFGDPIDLTNFIKEMKDSLVINSEQGMKIISDKVQSELLRLKVQTEKLHDCWNNKDET